MRKLERFIIMLRMIEMNILIRPFRNLKTAQAAVAVANEHADRIIAGYSTYLKRADMVAFCFCSFGYIQTLYG